MKNTWIIVGIIVLVVLGFVLFRGGALAPEEEVQPTAPSVEVALPEVARSLTVILESQNDSGERGSATLTAVEGGIEVVLDLVEGIPVDITQPAHIHTGSCANLGGVKYPLTFPLNGNSFTALDVSLDQLLSELPLAVNIHKSTDEPGVYVSCGEINP